MLPAPILSTAGAGDLGFLGHHIPKALEVYFSYPRAGHGGQGEQWADGQAGAMWQGLQAGQPVFWCSGGRHVESVPLYGQLSLIVIV